MAPSTLRSPPTAVPFGSRHLEQEEFDQVRTKYLEAEGYKVIRFWNNDVINDIEGVILAIIHTLEDRSQQ